MYLTQPKYSQLPLFLIKEVSLNLQKKIEITYLMIKTRPRGQYTNLQIQTKHLDPPK